MARIAFFAAERDSICFISYLAKSRYRLFRAGQEAGQLVSWRRARRVCTTLHASVQKMELVSASVYALGHSARALCALGCRSQPR